MGNEISQRAQPKDAGCLTQNELHAIRSTALCLEGMLGEAQAALGNGATVEPGPYSIDRQILSAVVAAGVPNCVRAPAEAAAAQVLPNLPNAALMGRLLSDDPARSEASPKVARALRKHNRRLYLQMLAALQMHVELAFVKNPALSQRTDWSDLFDVQFAARLRIMELQLAAYAHFFHLNPGALRVTRAIVSITALLNPRVATVIPFRPR